MYLSCLLIDVGDNPDRPRPGRLWLRNLYRVHQRLCMAFPSNTRKSADSQFLAPFNPDDFPELHYQADQRLDVVDRDTLDNVHTPRDVDRGFLFRIDLLLNGRAAIIVQSATSPDWDYAFHNASYLLAAPPQTKEFDPQLLKGMLLRFRLLANPTRKIETKSIEGVKRNGRRVPVATDKLHEWLSRKAKDSGFAVDDTSLIIQAGYAYVDKMKNGGGQQLRAVRYEGTLSVVDPELFREAIVCGIGPGKGFGFGLLSLARVPDANQGPPSSAEIPGRVQLPVC